MRLHVGFDIGSTTAKIVALNEKKEIVFKSYLRHFSEIKRTAVQLLKSLSQQFPEMDMHMNISGSSGLSLSEQLKIPFVQEVIACTEAVKTREPNIDVVIELGGEDAKIIYLTNGMEQRMNSACAGGTGAFIDQIASLLDTDASGLNKLAEKADKIYPIASRCGVFAKTDIQPLLNEGAKREDIAASVFQAVVNQTVGGLACGRPIRGNVALLGGPLTFLPALRNRFIETLRLKNESVMDSADGQYYVAIGAALESTNSAPVDIHSFLHILNNVTQSTNKQQAKRLPPLFKSHEELTNFQQRHHQTAIPKKSLSTYEGSCYLGIDAGSTTTKMVAIGENDEYLFSFYENNKGNPMKTVHEGLALFYSYKNDRTTVARSTVTGYGEKLIQAAFQVDEGQIETIAHYKAAKYFQPDVDFIIDIGGQDMKCITIKEGVIDQIMLNEACSAGCGSFLANFAATLNLTMDQFVQASLSSKAPVDLGSRCTVFMNSKVKQVQKEGAAVSDIAAGLAYSVVNNALYKVIKLRNAEQMGKNIVVQGGTFLNDGVLRAFELMIKKEVIRPEISGLMGAFGCALIAKENSVPGKQSTVLTKENTGSFQARTSHRRCGLCENHCPLTINRFQDKRVFVTGNRCERGAGGTKTKSTVPNLMEEKLAWLFNREPLDEKLAIHGKIGIPRVLNMYENYPFWYRFFTELGYEVVLSDLLTKKGYEKGMETIPSEGVCYPAKLTHGHIINLIEKGVKTIFYPSVVYEKIEHTSQDNHFNCPVVASYPEVLRVNMSILQEKQITFLNPFLSLEHLGALAKVLQDCFPHFAQRDIKRALAAAEQEEQVFRVHMKHRGEQVLQELKQSGKKGIVVGAHPYHLDPAIHHGVPDEITRLGYAVLTEDSICHLDEGAVDKTIQTVNQWTFHSRLYRAARVAASRQDLEFVHLTSFGCGLDAITTDTVQEILEKKHQLYTWIKMDEVNNLGAVRIRLRSLQAAIKERDQTGAVKWQRESSAGRLPSTFTKESKETYTILAPQLAPTHFKLFEAVFRQAGYRLKVIETVNEEHVEEGLRYVNNDACYPAILTIGQLLGELKSGEHDLERTAVVMSQTGGGCRATNYFALLKRALQHSGMGQIPVISLNSSGMEKQPGFQITLAFAKKLVIACCIGDLLMRLKLATRPYEKEKGRTEAVYESLLHRSTGLLADFSMGKYKRWLHTIIREFSRIDMYSVTKPRVGIVGEILVKFHPYANNQLIDIIEAEGGEAVVPDFLDFFLYGLYNNDFKAKQLGKKKWSAMKSEIAIQMMEYYRNPVREALYQCQRYKAPMKIDDIAEKAAQFLSIGNQMGEGWLLPGEMAELMEEGVRNIVCVQPFACLPNHILGRGMFNAIKKIYENANLVAIDYDAGASKVNQLNRIKLMINIAKSR
ncbi:CoA-substrate-specific enzyme activase, putative [Evansella caseinilytica]|uniref:CoA-substrate-specific enzyme activase, putative n=1 Tax=Evansella caseinilytica TaxID=1503961 RepID=A0A1H3TGT7_9BACI|nr:acyl-CoA dehydratase activase-related protein [Evansella caseinilytica]SDZ48875.1 CoA-substrate-specific enzyme activase, putative [Evansella caseinilytica]